MAEAAWVVARQAELAKFFPSNYPTADAHKNFISADYRFPTWKKGYELAERVRVFLGLGPMQAIESLRGVVEDDLQIPLVQQAMHQRLAGATIANGQVRGIVINEVGRNSNVWVRRVTLAHEVGHLLGDPDERLNRLKVDDYEAIGTGMRIERDVVEMRANGFAVAFLAPPEGVRAMVDALDTDIDRLNAVISRFGISRTAAKFHIRNVCDLEIEDFDRRDVVEPEDDWLGRENSTIDVFPINETAISRRGRFAHLVCLSARERHISTDSAVEWLKTSTQKF